MTRSHAVAITCLLASLAVAGCIEGDSPPPPQQEIAANGLELAAFNSVVEPDGRGGEPMLGIAPDGAMFTYSAPPGASWESVYRSLDGGANWTSVGARPLPETSGDPDLSVDRDGTVWFDALVQACTFVAVSRDAGATWIVGEKVCLGPAYDRPRIVPTEGGHAYLYHHNGQGSTSVLQTTDHGLTWLPVPAVVQWLAQNPLTSPGWGGGGFWNPATGSVFFTYTVTEDISPLLGLTSAPGYGVFREAGTTFEVHRIPGIAWTQGNGNRIGPGVVDGVADEEGNIYLTWAEAMDDEVRIRLVASRDDGRTWSEPINVDLPGGTAIFPTIAATSAGRIAIAYYETTAQGRPESVPADSSWNVTLAWTVDALADEPIFEYGTLSLNAIKVGPICPGGLVACGNQGGDRALLEYFDIQSLRDGRVAGVWSSTLAVPGNIVNVFGVTEEAILGPA